LSYGPIEISKNGDCGEAGASVSSPPPLSCGVGGPGSRRRIWEARSVTSSHRHHRVCARGSRPTIGRKLDRGHRASAEPPDARVRRYTGCLGLHEVAYASTQSVLGPRAVDRLCDLDWIHAAVPIRRGGRQTTEGRPQTRAALRKKSSGLKDQA